MAGEPNRQEQAEGSTPSSRHLLPWLLLLALAAAAACREAGPAAESGRPTVLVSIPPQAYVVTRIAGQRVAVATLIGPGQSHHTWEPTPRAIDLLARAALFLRIGVPFEEGLVGRIRQAYPSLRVVDTREGIPLRRMSEEGAGAGVPPPGADPAAAPGASGGKEPESHGHAGEWDPHFWLDPRLMILQGERVAAQLELLDPAGAEGYRRNLELLRADLEAADAELRRRLAPYRGREFFVFHPAFGYFADAYGLRQVAVEVEGKEPGARKLAAIVERARRSGARTIFVQAQFSQVAAGAVAREIGGSVVILDPLAEDYLANLREIGRLLEQALAASGPPAGAGQEGG